ncbi:MAG: protein tyrosine phosphatase family protein [Oscillatoriophycideae cyanobacterium NC_groundwater_1537_Pr4_S-0.65um_50_18]|nr:protein tyrosine phosphatase family protein [Oscillatoriophycideae cyanobacterium NC_groundwater_1537_Pr4_S-0.65um_50_18]
MSSHSLEPIYNFVPITEHLATAGQPTEAQFAEIKAAGYQVVINLALPNSTNAIAHEQAIVESAGLEYVHIPVIWENPTLEDLDRFFQTLKENTERKVFVHCAMNMRVSAFTYLYRVTQQQVDAIAAKAEMDKIWTPNETWQKFIDQAMQHYLPSGQG